jgi:3-phytase
VIGTNKKRGLAVYDLSGKEIQFVADGQMNNVDHRDDFPLDGKNVPIVTASNRSNNSIAIYKINTETKRLENVAVGIIKTFEAYGSCMYHSSKSGKFYYFGTSKQGLVEQYELFDAGNGTVNANLGLLFPKGVFIAQDCSDDTGKQNFKLVPWQLIEGN